MINKVTPRSRNSAADKRYVTPDQYTDAVNIRVENSFSESGENSSGNVGVIKPVKGTTAVSGDGGLSSWRIVGKVLDVPTDTVYFAAIQSNSEKNGVWKINPQTTQIEQVVRSPYFAWDGVSHVDMSIARSREGGAILYLTDGVNAPYKVDVKFFEDNPGLVGKRMYDAITVCPITPNQVISGSFSFDSESKSSNFKNLPGVQFAYQSVYETGEISALSSYSDVLVPPSYVNQGAGTLETLDSFNRVDIIIPGLPSSVESVKLLIRFGDTGSWFIVRDIDRSLSERQSQSPISASFYNDEILPQLPSQESKRLFDSVPIKAATNEVQEDRLFYGNYSEGRDNAPAGSSVGTTQTSLSVIYEDRPDDFNPITIDIEPQVIPLRRKDESGNDISGGICPNRVAGIKVSVGSDPSEIVSAGSTVVFDFTTAPDKNFHIYESSHSFHANTEIYNFDDQNSSFQENYNKNALSGDVVGDGNAKYNWTHSLWGFSDQALKTGVYSNQTPSNFRYGVSDEVISGNTATWTVKKGPLQGEILDVVYGSSPATPLILRGGEISFSVKFRLLRDLSIGDIVSNIIKFLDEDPNAGYIEEFNPVTQAIELTQVAQLIDSTIRGGYSIDMGAGNGRSRFSRNSAAADVVCAVGDRNWASSFESLPSGSAPDGTDYWSNPVGYFMVDKADVEFKLRDVTNLGNVQGVSGVEEGESFFLALDITSVSNLNIVTMIPVLELNTSSSTTLTMDPYTKPSRSKWDNEGEHDGANIPAPYGLDDISIDSDFYRIHHGNVVNAWVSIGDDSAWENPEIVNFDSLFDCLYESTSGPTYKKIFDYNSQPQSFKDDIEEAIENGNYKAQRENVLRWFGSLKLASDIGGDLDQTSFIGDGFSDFVDDSNTRRLIHTYERALEREVNSGNFTDTPTAQTYANFAFSLVDGEGGIGSWKGSLLDNAAIVSGKLLENSKQDDPDGWDDINYSYSASDLQNAFKRFTGKIEGSITTSMMFGGQLKVGMRYVADDRAPFGTGYNASNHNYKGFYPDVPYADAYGPVLAGFYYPFQYLFLSAPVVNFPNFLTSGYKIDSDFYAGVTGQGLDVWQEQIIETFIDNPDSSYWMGNSIPGYLKHGQVEEGSEVSDARPSSVELISDNTYILTSDQDASVFRSFKRSSNHSLGMVYYDYFGRPGTVIPFPSVYVGGYSDSELPAGNNGQGPTRIKVDFSLSNIPEWAHSYKFVYGGNNTTNDFIQYSAGGAFVAVNTNEDDEDDQVGNIYVSLNYLQSNPDVSYANAFGAVSDLGDKDLYKFSGGDRLKVLSFFEGDSLESRQFPSNFEFEIVDVVTLTGDPNTNPLWNIEDGDQVPRYLQGQFVVVKNNPTASMFTYASVRNADNASETTSHKWNNRAVLEIYSPRSKRESEEIVYREIGDSFKIVNVPTTILGQTYYQRSHEHSGHIISQGDVWFRRIAMNMPQFKNGKFRNIIRGSNASSPRFLDYLVESNRFTDQFADSSTIGLGKPVIYSPEAKELNKPSSVIFSNINTRSSKYNRLSTFDATTANFKEIPNDHGDIKIMIKDGDSLATFQESKLSLLPINRSVLADASNNASLIASSKTIGNQVFIPGDFGVGDNPESVLYVDGAIYFANPYRKEVYRYSPGKRGVETISDAGMQDYFNNLFEGDPSTSKVVSGFDYKNDEFLISYETSVTPMIYSTPPSYPTVDTYNDGFPGVEGSLERSFKTVPSGVPSSPTPNPVLPTSTYGLTLSSPSLPTSNIAQLPKSLKTKVLSLLKKAKPSFRRFRKDVNRSRVYRDPYK